MKTTETIADPVAAGHQQQIVRLPEPYYDRDGITIYCADARRILPNIADGFVTVTDPVYGIDGGRGGDAKDFGKGKYSSGIDTEEYVQFVCVPVIALAIYKSLRAAVTPGIRCLHLYPRPHDIGCFWTPAAATHGPWGFTTFQPILYYGKDYRAGKGALPTGRQVTEPAVKNGHPCPKPTAAWRWLIDKMSADGELVVDPFMGSGTTLVAAKMLGRRAIGIEISEEYCEIAVKQLRQNVFDFSGTDAAVG